MKWWLKSLLPAARPTLYYLSKKGTWPPEHAHVGRTTVPPLTDATQTESSILTIPLLLRTRCSTVWNPKRIFPCQECVCFHNGFQCLVTGSPMPPVRWSASVNAAPNATVRSVSLLAQMSWYSPKNSPVPCFLVSSLWENKRKATWRCFGQRKNFHFSDSRPVWNTAVNI